MMQLKGDLGVGGLPARLPSCSHKLTNIFVVAMSLALGLFPVPGV